MCRAQFGDIFTAYDALKDKRQRGFAGVTDPVQHQDFLSNVVAQQHSTEELLLLLFVLLLPIVVTVVGIAQRRTKLVEQPAYQQRVIAVMVQGNDTVALVCGGMPYTVEPALDCARVLERAQPINELAREAA